MILVDNSTTFTHVVLRLQKGEVGGVTRKVTCTWWLLGLTVKAPWLGPGRPILALASWTGLAFPVGKAVWALNGCMTTESADSLDAR